jgi:hypothetical protein
MLFTLILPGCHSVNLRHASGGADQPRVSEETAEQFVECAELLEAGQHSVEAKVVADEDGRVLDVKTEGAPNSDVGMCIRVALRGMRVRKDVIDEAKLKLRQASSSSPNAETMPNRAYIGEVVTITVITIVFVEVTIETVAVALGVAVTATVVAGMADAAQAKAAQAKAGPARKPHQPDVKKWLEKGGTIQDHADGTRTFTRSDGVAVTYGKDGFPDFTRYRHPTVKDVQIEFTGSYDKDNTLADKAAGITKEKRDSEEYIWHHHQDGKTMQLIRRDVHKDFFHTGGMSGTR